MKTKREGILAINLRKNKGKVNKTKTQQTN